MKRNIKKLAKGLRLERIFFEGRQDPRPYYRESSLFMMTSLYEGWPMTINESLQFGCVPFAFDVNSVIARHQLKMAKMAVF